MLWQDLEHKCIAIWGMGREGLAVKQTIQKHISTAEITEITEDNLGDIFKAQVLVKSPGVSLYRPEIAKAKELGIIVTSGTNIFMANKNPNTKVIAITGTKGKSTTSSLMAHTLKAYGFNVCLGANIGVPLIDFVDEPADYVVAELSSYQCADFVGQPDVTVLLNLYPEHLQWHGSHEQYYADKQHMWKQGLWQLDNRENEIKIENDYFMDVDKKLFPISSLNLRGVHNAQNACAVLAVLKHLGLDLMKAEQAFHSFKGLAHRLQIVGEKDGLTFVDDSISTTPETAICAMESFEDKKITLLVGGFDRGQDYTKLNQYIKDNGVKAIALPTTGDRVETPHHVQTIKEAVALAKQITEKGGIILLSPAAPSYNQYKNFEARGDDFKKWI
ncbi:MAG: hypothetical protein II942_03630 [Alphaproteobacteria bacterium]|nr:hypothetical protein [Alphaproteobacteria bacterium]